MLLTSIEAYKQNALVHGYDITGNITINLPNSFIVFKISSNLENGVLITLLDKDSNPLDTYISNSAQISNEKTFEGTYPVFSIQVDFGTLTPVSGNLYIKMSPLPIFNKSNMNAIQ